MQSFVLKSPRSKTTATACSNLAYLCHGNISLVVSHFSRVAKRKFRAFLICVCGAGPAYGACRTAIFNTRLVIPSRKSVHSCKVTYPDIT